MVTGLSGGSRGVDARQYVYVCMYVMTPAGIASYFLMVSHVSFNKEVPELSSFNRHFKVKRPPHTDINILQYIFIYVCKS
jgi:hypothetical protein